MQAVMQLDCQLAPASSYVVMRSFLSPTEQASIIALLWPLPHPEAHAKASVRVELKGLPRVGAPLPPCLDALAAAGRRAFKSAALALSAPAALEALGSEAAALTAQALVYGPAGEMEPHVDASVARRPKWLTLFSLGCECDCLLDAAK